MCMRERHTQQRNSSDSEKSRLVVKHAGILSHAPTGFSLLFDVESIDTVRLDLYG